MLQQTHDTKKINTAELVLPSDTKQESATVLPSAAPKSPLDLPVEIFTHALDRREVNRKALLKWIASNLQATVDYGKIHVVGKNKCQYARDGRQQDCPNKYHWSKPSLWKPGAEKISGMLGLIPRFPNIYEYEKAVLSGQSIKVIILKCELHTPSGFIAAEGTGARRVEQDRGDINKSLKMAEKSAHIDATLRVAGLSEIFTQDIEDMINDKDNKNKIQPDTNNVNRVSSPKLTERDSEYDDHSSTNNNRKQSNDTHNPPTDNENARGYGNSQRLTSKQYRYLMDLCQLRGVSENELNKHCLEAFGVSVNYLSKPDASSLINNLLTR